MRHRFFAAALLALTAFPALAQELRYGWCETRAADGTYLMSGLMQQPKGSSDDVYKQGFGAAVDARGDIHCWFYYSSPSDGKSHFGQRQYVIESQEKARFTLTGWVGPYGVAGEPSAKLGGAYLTVEPDQGAARAAADYSRSVKQMRQKDEADLARSVAASAAAKAESEAALAAFLAEMRKRGRAQ